MKVLVQQRNCPRERLLAERLPAGKISAPPKGLCDGIIVNTEGPQGCLTPLCYFLMRQKKNQKNQQLQLVFIRSDNAADYTTLVD